MSDVVVAPRLTMTLATGPTIAASCCSICFRTASSHPGGGTVRGGGCDGSRCEPEGVDGIDGVEGRDGCEGSRCPDAAIGSLMIVSSDTAGLTGAAFALSNACRYAFAS